MIPSDFRLPNVANGLITRLEGTRRSFADDPGAGEARYATIAAEQVEAALAELGDLDFEIEGHRELLEDEITQTFLPRYSRLAAEMNASERRNFGLGVLGDPTGRVLLFGIALASLGVFLRFMYLPWAWPMVLLDLSLPFWPDILSAVHRRRYRGQLQEIIDDLSAIQDQATQFAPVSRETSRRPIPPIRESQ